MEVLFVDILIEHIIHVKIVLQKLHEAGLEVKLSKCMFTDIFYETMVHSSTRVKTNAKLTTTLNFYSPCPRTWNIIQNLAQCFSELKVIQGLARSKQYDKSAHPVMINIADRVMLHDQSKFKLIKDHTEYMKCQKLLSE